MNKYAGFAFAAAFALGTALPACADDLVKLTIGQRGNWDTAIAHLGAKAGIFKKHGIELEMIYTSGSGETLQPVIGIGHALGECCGRRAGRRSVRGRGPQSSWKSVVPRSDARRRRQSDARVCRAALPGPEVGRSQRPDLLATKRGRRRLSISTRSLQTTVGPRELRPRLGAG